MIVAKAMTYFAYTFALVCLVKEVSIEVLQKVFKRIETIEMYLKCAPKKRLFCIITEE